MIRRLLVATLVSVAVSCVARPPGPSSAIVVGITSSPSSFDPRFGLDDVAQKAQALLYDPLVTIDERLRIAPALALSLDKVDDTTYDAVLRRGVRFHDGHDLTAADVVHTFRSVLDPALGSPKRGAYRLLVSVAALDDYRVRFSLSAPQTSFPYELVPLPIIPAGAGQELGAQPIGTGPYRLSASVADDHVALAPFADHWRGAPSNAGLVLKVVPDEVMRALEVRKGTMDIVLNDISPDLYVQLARDGALQAVTAPGVDYQYVGINLVHPILRDVRVRRALAHAVDRQAIAKYLRRDLATPAAGVIPPMSWAYEPEVDDYAHDPARARELFDAAGFTDPDGAGPGVRFTLELKISNQEFNRLQAAVLQEDFRRVGVGLAVRTHEFATLFADVLAGNFQLYTLQWTAGSLADPDILRRVFHSGQVPPVGFNRGRYQSSRVDALLDAAARTGEEAARRALYRDAQREIARDVPYLSLWHKTNFLVAQHTLSGLQLTPLADFTFLRAVSRTRGRAAS